MDHMMNQHDPEIVLSIVGAEKTFPGVRALFNMNLDLFRGEVHAVCGENGAGKSTLMKIITGVYQADHGDILLNGNKLKLNNPNDAYAQGLAIIFQETSLFPELTVLENLFMGHELRKPLVPGIKYPVILDYPAMRTKAEEIFTRLGLEIDLSARVADLGVATKQEVEIAKALTFDSQILILDEPTAALSNKEVQTLFETIERLKAHGVSMLYISHRLDEVFEIADRVTVMRDGEHIKTEQVKNVTKSQLIAWMVGRTLDNLYPKSEVELGEIIFEARGITQEGVLNGIDLNLRRGEILGISGLAGAGRTELALALCGLAQSDSGEIVMNGNRVKIGSYRKAIENGLVYISEDRAKYGLVVPMAIRENITFPLLRKLTNRLGIIDAAAESKIAEGYVHSLSIRAPNEETVVSNLSGGNQQKVSVAKALAPAPQILILDEPTRGVDVGAKSEIHRIMGDLVTEGHSIIMISSDLPEIIAMSDRVVVMKNGAKVGELLRNELSQERILEMAL
ncbi:MAG TPA: sugar ABC transporter ATP-binding protein [Spirochaetia bacterium]|nr:sugar ABC transporter ATP-binding protein [Spirochaetia bacterium]